ncbi:MAG: DUF4188 domain-containing protein [Cumulibacter sp.]
MSLNYGRFTVSADQEVTVFLIGMRLNKPLAITRWWPVLTAMPRMLRHLAEDQDVGMLSFQSWFGRTTVLLSYWRSPEHLQRFAAASDAPHLPAWRDFVRRVGDDGTVGVWHETYVVPASAREVVYVNMPEFGLGKALGAERIGAGAHTAKQRLRRGYSREND